MWGQSLLWEVLFQVIVCTLGAFLILVLYLAAVLGNGFNIIAISLGFLSGLIRKHIGYYHQSTAPGKRRRLADSHNILRKDVLKSQKQQQLPVDVREKQQDFLIYFKDPSQGTRLLSESNTCQEVSVPELGDASVQDMTSCIKQPKKVDDRTSCLKQAIKVNDDHTDENHQQLPVDVLEHESNDTLYQDWTFCLKQAMKVNDDHDDENHQQLPVDVLEHESNDTLVQDSTSYIKPINVDDDYVDDHVDENQQLLIDVKGPSKKIQLPNESNTFSEVLEFKHNNTLVQDMTSCTKQLMKVDVEDFSEETQATNCDDGHVDENEQQLPVDVKDSLEGTQLPTKSNTSSEVLELQHNNDLVQDMTPCAEQPMIVQDDSIDKNHKLLPADLRQNQQMPANVEDLSKKTQAMKDDDDHVDENQHQLPVDVEYFSEKTQLLREIDTSEVSEFKHNNALVQNMTSCEKQPINVEDDHVDENLSLSVVVEDFSEDSQHLCEIDTSEFSEFEHNNALVQDMTSCKKQPMNVGDDYVDENLQLSVGVKDSSEKTQLLSKIGTSEFSEFEHNNAVGRDMKSCEKQLMNVDDDHVDDDHIDDDHVDENL